MNEFIPSYSFTEWKKLKPEQIRELKNCEITFNGDYLFTFINGSTEPSGYLMMKCQYDGAAANSVSGKDLKDVLEETLCQA